MGIGEVAAAWALGEAAFKIGIKKRWIRGSIRRKRRQIFYDVWGDFVDEVFAQGEQRYLAAILASESFSDSIELAMDGDWTPPRALASGSVLSEIRHAFSLGEEDRPVDFPDPVRKTVFDQREAFKAEIRDALGDGDRFLEWYRSAIRRLFDELHFEYNREESLGPVAEQQLYEFRKQEETIEEIRGTTKTIMALLVIYAGLTVGATGVDLMMDKVLNTPGLNTIAAAGGTAVLASLRSMWDAVSNRWRPTPIRRRDSRGL